MRSSLAIQRREPQRRGSSRDSCRLQATRWGAKGTRGSARRSFASDAWIELTESDSFRLEEGNVHVRSVAVQ